MRFEGNAAERSLTAAALRSGAGCGVCAQRVPGSSQRMRCEGNPAENQNGNFIPPGIPPFIIPAMRSIRFMALGSCIWDIIFFISRNCLSS